MSLKTSLLIPFKKSDKDSGMTILEIMIVIALMATIMTVLVTKLLDKNDEAKSDLSSVALSRLSDDFTYYKLNTGRFPSTEEGLQALLEAPASARNWKGPYVDADKINDAWSRPYQYELLNAKSFKLTSAGPDGEFGNSDDIVYPKEAAQPKEEAPVTAELKVPEGNLKRTE